ncbi:MAG: BamA/TamA family outer membrane protein, partial [Bacteroidetes bacterium]|nr:BamA/TamA family outer membrane protein [Bacteroidota bacterium]
HHSKKWGFKTHFEWVENKNLAVATQSNKLVYWKSENVLRTVLFGQLSLIYQPKFLEAHEISIGLHNGKIADTVALFNPNYLPAESSKTSQTAFKAGYTFVNDKRNRKGYPTKGYLFGLSANHAQFFNGLHLSSISARINLHHPIKDFHFSSQTQAFTSFGTTQPYFLQRGFGWNNNLVRGYNYHVIEAEHFAIQKLEFGRMLTPLQKQFNKLPRQFKLLSITPVPKAFLDFGYTSSQNFTNNGTLNNQFLLGYGLGLDLVYYYDNLWRFEYARSIHGTSGLFLNFTMFIQ